MVTKYTPNVGSLLVSEPFMLDQNFRRSVVLLTEHNVVDGTLGFVLNQESNLLLKDVIDACDPVDFPLFIGGPVATDTLHYIHNCYEKMNSGIEVAKGVYWGGNFETLKVLLSAKQILQTEIKFFIGYSGWSPHQLDEELEQNSWLVSNDFNSDIVFENEEENLWKDAILALGPKYAHIVNFPENPTLN